MTEKKQQKIKDILSDKTLREHNSYVEVLAWPFRACHTPSNLTLAPTPRPALHPEVRRPGRSLPGDQSGICVCVCVCVSVCLSVCARKELAKSEKDRADPETGMEACTRPSTGVAGQAGTAGEGQRRAAEGPGGAFLALPQALP